MSSRKHNNRGMYDNFQPNPNRQRVQTTEAMYRRILTELSINRFKWEGLPDSVDERFLELTLFQQALCVFYFERSYNRYLALRGFGEGRPNMYENPTRFRVTGNTMINRSLGAKECVPIWANSLRIPDSDVVYLYASRLASIDKTLEINALSARNTVVIFADENERLTMANTWQQIEAGLPVIKATPAMDLAKIQSINLGVHPDAIMKMQQYKNMVWNECMTMLGINNANQDKRERLVSDEVSANNDQVVAQRGAALNARARACDEISSMFGLPVKVSWSNSVDQQAQRLGIGPGVSPAIPVSEA